MNCVGRIGWTSVLQCLMALGFVACGDTSGNEKEDNQETYTLGGSAVGLETGTVLIALNQVEQLALDGNGDFSFPSALESGQEYVVSVVSQSAGLSCTVQNGVGVVGNTSVDNLVVLCRPSAQLQMLEVVGESSLIGDFSPERTEYQVSVRALVGAVNITPTAYDPGAIIRINGTPVSSGQTLADLSLHVGTTSLEVEVTSSHDEVEAYSLSIERSDSPIERWLYAKAIQPRSNDMFGAAVALDGDWLAVGAPGHREAIGGQEYSGAVFLFRRSGSMWTIHSHVTIPSEGSDSDFGYSIFLSGDRLAVGAPSGTAIRSGAAYVYRFNGVDWEEEDFIVASNPDSQDEFGHSVALHGDILVVGAPSEDSEATSINGSQGNSGDGADSGAAYIFARTDNGWEQSAYLKPSEMQSHGRFGSAVSVYEKTVAVGAPSENPGAVYVFTRVASSWAQDARLEGSNPASLDYFGASLSLNRAALAIGAPGEDSMATGIDGDETNNAAANSGAVYLFERTSNGWNQGAYVKAHNTQADDDFGRSVSLKGGTLAVGAPRDDTGDLSSTDDSGAVHVYVSTSSGWTHRAYVRTSFPDPADRFGTSVQLSNYGLAAGALLEDSSAAGISGDEGDNSLINAGAAFLFR